MKTPFNEQFKVETYTTSSIIGRGYIVLGFIPNLNYIFVHLDNCDDILSSAYIIEKVTLDNYGLYSDAEIDNYVLSWGEASSSSSSASELELKTLLESGIYTFLQVRYVTVT